MPRRILLFLPVVALLLLLPLTSQALDTPPAAPTPSSPAAEPAVIHRLSPSAGNPGFYIGNGRGRTPLSPTTYHAVGSFTFWAWAELEPAQDVYHWDALDGWIQHQIDAGYQSVGLAFYTYIGRYVPCPQQGVDSTPAWVLAGADGVRGTSDDPVIIAAEPDKRDGPGCTNFGGDWYLLNYEHPFYRQNYQAFIQALASHLLNGPFRDNIGWIAMGTGKDGENRAADNRSWVAQDENHLLSQGLTVDDWLAYVTEVMETHRTAFYDNFGTPIVPVLTQNAPFYISVISRRSIADYAAARGIGVSVNGMTSDFQGTELCDNPNPSQHCTGMYDQARQYYKNIPIMFESYKYMMATPNEFYWSMARALDMKADYMRLSAFWDAETTQPDNLTTAEWAAQYFGRGFESGQTPPPSIWSRMREHRDPCPLSYVKPPPECNWWPTNGNYEFYLTQLHLPDQGGVTIPVTDNDSTRVTGWDYPGSTVVDKPWHYNTSPYDQKLRDAGLFHLLPEFGVQIEVDPGFVARRSDQASGNFAFYFAADDRYLAQPLPGHAHEVRITITYLDTGNDQWKLIYDATSGPKAATLYAIQNWDTRTGLALDPGLPTSGVVPDPKPDYVQKTNTGTWKVATFYITDGYFGNRLPGGADFYVDSRSAAG
ncbi:MAG: hypothetical protein D6775_07560, partial [Caldilineae bacterium]